MSNFATALEVLLNHDSLHKSRVKFGPSKLRTSHMVWRHTQHTISIKSTLKRMQDTRSAEAAEHCLILWT
jgi:hypothetical protein